MSDHREALLALLAKLSDSVEVERSCATFALHKRGVDLEVVRPEILAIAGDVKHPGCQSALRLMQHLKTADDTVEVAVGATAAGHSRFIRSSGYQALADCKLETTTARRLLDQGLFERIKVENDDFVRPNAIPAIGPIIVTGAVSAAALRDWYRTTVNVSEARTIAELFPLHPDPAAIRTEVESLFASHGEQDFERACRVSGILADPVLLPTIVGQQSTRPEEPALDAIRHIGPDDATVEIYLPALTSEEPELGKANLIFALTWKPQRLSAVTRQRLEKALLVLAPAATTDQLRSSAANALERLAH